MYVLKCVKPGYFNCDRSAGTGHFVTDEGDSTRSIYKAAFFATRHEAILYSSTIEHVNRMRGDAHFKPARIIITLK